MVVSKIMLNFAVSNNKQTKFYKTMKEIKVNGNVLVVPSREVYVPELKEFVSITTERIKKQYNIEDGDENDDLFAGYVSDEVFNTMADEAFQRYVLCTFYDELPF